jgi:hypothetical protein
MSSFSASSASIKEQVSGLRQPNTSTKRHLPPIASRRQSGFMLFRLEALASLKATFPEVPGAERVQMVSKQWGAMSKADKEVSGALFRFDLDAHRVFPNRVYRFTTNEP